mgnify:CR=1 FL=1
MLPSLTKGLEVFDSLFNETLDEAQKSIKRETGLMKTDISEDDKNLYISMELAGYNKEDVNIELDDGYVTVHAERKENNETKDHGYIRRERYIGSCSRTFYIGDEISEEDIKAKYENGLLKITVPKEEKKLENKRQISID